MKLMQILSNGSLIFSFNNFITNKQVVFIERDNINFHFNNKKKSSKIELKSSSVYKKKFFT
jgi:hypothetical protein